MCSHLQIRGFSIVDLLIVIAIIGALCGIGVPALSAVRSKTAEIRLQSDVDTINRAISVFEAKGGKFDGVTDPNAILGVIKSREARSAGIVHFLGAADQMIDLRLTAMIQTNEETESLETRAVWNVGLKRFIVAQEGKGVKRFFVNYD